MVYSEAPIIRDIFLFLRTSVAVAYANDAIGALALAFPHSDPSDAFEVEHKVPVLGFGKDQETFENGLVLRVRSIEPARDFALRKIPALEKFEAWAVHDRCGDFVEHPAGGLFSRYFETLVLRKSGRVEPLPLCHLFLMAREADPRFEQTLTEIRGSMKEQCLPVFHFRDGAVLLLNSRAPGNITANRCQHFLNRLEHWAITDSEGITRSEKGKNARVWIPTNLQYLEFGNDEDC